MVALVLLMGCASQIKVKFSKPEKPSCGDVVTKLLAHYQEELEYYEAHATETVPALTLPTPYDFIDLIKCIKKLEIGYE